MTIYIAFLRGINVGSKNRIKMDELKQIFHSLGLQQVETYIQSGNVIFESNDQVETLKKNIEEAIENTAGFSVPIILRTSYELKQIVLDCPFTEEEINSAELSNTEGESLYVALLQEIPISDKIDLLSAFRTDYEDFRVLHDNIFLLLTKSIRNSKLANQLQKLTSSVTVRNLNTIKKLIELVNLRM